MFLEKRDVYDRTGTELFDLPTLYLGCHYIGSHKAPWKPMSGPMKKREA